MYMMLFTKIARRLVCIMLVTYVLLIRIDRYQYTFLTFHPAPTTLAAMNIARDAV